MNELPPGIANLLNSCQVITSVASVVKELIENSLDAHSSRIDVKLENSGFDKIEVRDNGDGIEQADVQYAARPHYTSKITNEEDLKSLHTYGFRGEALGALCNVANVLIITKTKQDDVSINYKFDHCGKVISSKPSSLGQGTSVIVENLFENVPVRRQFCSNAKKKKEEMKKVEDMMISFASIHPHIRFTVYHNQMQIWQKMSVCDVKSALLLTLGANMANVLEHKLAKNEEYKIVIDAFLPKAGLSVQQTSRTSFERCIIAVNNRPVRVKNIDKLLNTYYSHAYHIDSRWSRYPVCYISVTVPPSTLDVNIEPDKSSVLFHYPEIVLGLLTSVLAEIYGKIDNVEKSSMPMDQELYSNEKTCQNSANIKNTSDDKSMPLYNEVVPGFSEKHKEINGKNSDNNLIFSSLNDKNDNYNIVEKYHEESLLNSESLIDGLKDDAICQSQKHTEIPEFSMDDVISSWLDNDEELGKMADIEKSHVFPQNRKENTSDATSQINEVTDSADPVNQAHETMNSKQSEWSRGTVRSENGEAIESVRILAPSLEKPPKSVSTSNSSKTSASKLSSPNKKKRRVEEAFRSTTIYDAFKRQPVRQPLTPYALFCKVKKPKVISANPMTQIHVISNILKEKWEKLPVEKKRHYEILADEEKARHKVEQDKELIGQKTDLNKLSQAVVELRQQNMNKKETKGDKHITRDYIKYRPKEENVKVNLEQLKQTVSKNSSEEKVEKSSFLLVGQLGPSGTWIVTYGYQVLAINHFRILEVLEYHRLITHHCLPLTSLESPIALSESVLGSTNVWNELLNLKCEKDEVAGYSSVIDDKLIANGFHIRIFDDTAEIIRLTDKLPFYGLPDLIEILQLIVQYGSETTLEQCRPQKVVQFFQGEAVRTTRNAPSNFSADRMKNILRQLEELPEYYKSCLHGKPFFHLLYDLDDIPLTQI